MQDHSNKLLEIELTDLVTGLPFYFDSTSLHEFDNLSTAARIESIVMENAHILHTNVTDRSYNDVKALCQLYLDHNAEVVGFQFYAVLVAYILNTALTVDQAYSFVDEKMLYEVKESELALLGISISELYKQAHPDKPNTTNLITSSIGGYKYLFFQT